MNTFLELNNFGALDIPFTDNRPFGVVFDKSVNAKFDKAFTITEKQITVLPIINILEIIQPNNANVEYEIALPISQATVEWDNLPAGVTQINVGNRYILQNITTPEQYQAIKDPNITIDDDFFGEFFYEVKIRYNTPQGPQTVSGTVGLFVPVAQLNSEFVQVSQGSRFITVSLDFVAFNTVLSEGTKILPIQAEASVNVNSSISTDPNYFKGTSVNVSAEVGLTADVAVIPTVTLATARTITPMVDFYLSDAHCNENYSAIGSTVNEQVKVYNNNTGSLTYTINRPNTNYSGFGFCITMNDTIMSVGSNSGTQQVGAVYQYSLTTGTLLRTINNPNPANVDNFGGLRNSIGMSDDYTIVGTNNSGYAYVFNNNDGSLEHTINVGNNNTKTSVDITNTHFIVGDNDSGNAYVFDTQSGNLLHTLTKDVLDEDFGTAVTITDDYAVVGIPGFDGTEGASSGRVKVYNISNGTLKWTLTNPNPDGSDFNDSFGFNMRSNDVYLIVGVPFENVTGAQLDNYNQGAVYTFNLVTGLQMQTLYSPETNLEGRFDQFGWGIGLSDSKAVISDGSPDSTTESFYIYNII